MLRTRNELAHDYDGAIIKSACMTIIGRYLDLFYDFRNTVDELLKESEHLLFLSEYAACAPGVNPAFLAVKSRMPRPWTGGQKTPRWSFPPGRRPV